MKRDYIIRADRALFVADWHWSDGAKVEIETTLSAWPERAERHADYRDARRVCEFLERFASGHFDVEPLYPKRSDYYDE